MAAPDSATVKDLTGKWVMNKKLTGDFDGVLQLQGIGWITRKAIGVATITLHIKHATQDDGEHIDIDQVLTGGIQGTREERILDHQWRAHTDHIFGELSGRSRRVKLADIEDNEDGKFMKADWSQDVLDGGDVIESHVKNEKSGWEAWQNWGFEVIDGERRHVRHVIVWTPKDKKRVKLVYDWQA